MFFLIRCVFWLWVVFSTIFAHTSAIETAAGRSAAVSPRTERSVVRTAQAWIQTAAPRVADRCATSPATCLAVAAQLSKLTTRRDMGRSSQGSTDIAPVLEPAARLVDVPLPPRRPEFIGTATAAVPLEKTARREYLMGRHHAEADF